LNSPHALAWVKAEDARSLKVLQAEPHYAGFYSQSLVLAEAKDRIPVPEFTGEQITNLWQDSAHVQGCVMFPRVFLIAGPANTGSTHGCQRR